MVRPRSLRRLHLSLRGRAIILFQEPRGVRFYVAYQSPVTACDEIWAIRIPSEEDGALRLGKRRWRRQVVSDAPWNLERGDHSCLSEDADRYCGDKIRIGPHATVSQRSFICRWDLTGISPGVVGIDEASCERTN